jgi:cyclopropane fatty-acyl-phospholipid synthase-like methyltransferase
LEFYFMQALSEITQQLLQRASLAKGMRVLDIGSGSGESIVPLEMLRETMERS